MSAVAAPELVARPHAVPTRSVLLPLALVEARRLLLHPLTAIGLVLSALFVYQMADQTVGGSYMVLMGAAVYPLACTTMIAANAATLRSRRDRTAELYGTLPAPRTVHTLALALSRCSRPPCWACSRSPPLRPDTAVPRRVPTTCSSRPSGPTWPTSRPGPWGSSRWARSASTWAAGSRPSAASVFTVVALTVASIPLVTWNVDSPCAGPLLFDNPAQRPTAGWPLRTRAT